MDLPPDLPDEYDEETDGPEAQMFRAYEQEIQRATGRLNAMLRAIERDGDPIEQGRRAAARLWRAYCERVWQRRGW
jgi:hypothetical protein